MNKNFGDCQLPQVETGAFDGSLGDGWKQLSIAAHMPDIPEYVRAMLKSGDALKWESEGGKHRWYINEIEVFDPAPQTSEPK